MKTIAVDIDDVLALHAKALVKYSNNMWATNLTIEDYDEHWGKMWGLPMDKVEERSVNFHNSGIYKEFGIIENSNKALNRLKKKYKLVVTTTRRKIVRNDTYEWLEKNYNKIFNEIHFVDVWGNLQKEPYKQTKLDICKYIAADYLIDDQLKHCLAVDSAGITALLFGNYSWNRAVSLPDSIIKVNNWKEVEEYFDSQEA